MKNGGYLAAEDPDQLRGDGGHCLRRQRPETGGAVVCVGPTNRSSGSCLSRGLFFQAPRESQTQG